MKIFTILMLLTCSVYSGTGIYPIKNLEINSSPKELAFITKIAKDAQIVGIGESGHGSQGYNKARTKLIKHLVERMGYRLILLEEGFDKTIAVNKYLKACSKNSNIPDPQNILKKLNSIYQNKSSQNLLEYLCRFNIKHPKDPVVFQGIDIWEDPWTFREIIKKATILSDEENIKKGYKKAFKNCFAWQVDSLEEAKKLPSWKYLLETWRLPVEEHRRCLAALFNLDFHIDGSSIKLKIKFHIKHAIRVASVFERFRDLNVFHKIKALNLRDDMQAYLSMRWFQRFKENKKTILLAHNIHVSKFQSNVVPSDHGSTNKWVNVRSTGENLRASLGSGYKSIALTGYKVSSSRDGDYPVLKRNDSLDYKLKKISERYKLGNYLVVDPKKNWIKKQNWWMHNESLPMYQNPSEQFDAIFFIKHSPAAVGF